jgi:glycosyltransferase involved in cell wall biosynthesis
MKTAVLISTYNWKEALNLLFESIKKQTRLPNELLIADDGSQEDTRQLVGKFAKEMAVPLKHIWHEDKGFRKSAILNKAIAQTDADYIIQLDGDCIPERHFVEDHILNARADTYLYGARVNILPQYVEKVFDRQIIDFNCFSREIKNRTRAVRLKVLADLYKPHNEISRKMRGCNLSFWRKDFVSINGYNEDMEGWGREDSEMVCRLHNNDVQAKRLRYCGLVFHIYHPEASRENFKDNDKIEKMTRSNKLIRCEKGIDKYL